MKYVVEIEGLPEGWEPIRANAASGLMINENDKNLVITVFLEIQKTKPREITLVETDEYFKEGGSGHQVVNGEVSFISDAYLSHTDRKIWRVKEK